MKSALLRMARRLRAFPFMRSIRDYLAWAQGIALAPSLRRIPLQPKTVIFESYQGRSYACSPRAIYRAMVTDPRFADWRFVWAFADTKNVDPEIASHPRTHVVSYCSPEYFRAFAAATYWVVNAMLPLKIRKRPGQKMLQCWHGTPFKRLRADVEGTRTDINGSRDFSRKNRLDVPRFDAFTFQSDFGERTLSSAFEFDRFNPGLERLRFGLPRNTELFDYSPQRITEIRTRLGIAEGKTVVLYAPTYRDDAITANASYHFSQPIDYNNIMEGLGADTVLLFRAHYMITEVPDFAAFADRIIDVSQVPDITDLYVISQLLITDYSSVFFDYAALQRPIVFFMKDLENYRDNLRGFYLPLSQLPGPVTTTESELVPAIKSGLANPSGCPRPQTEELVSWDSATTTTAIIDSFFALM